MGTFVDELPNIAVQIFESGSVYLRKLSSGEPIDEFDWRLLAMQLGKSFKRVQRANRADGETEEE